MNNGLNQGCQNCEFALNRKRIVKLQKSKIANKINGFYSINFVESEGENKIAKSKIAPKNNIEENT
jgi:hypothetical protein